MLRFPCDITSAPNTHSFTSLIASLPGLASLQVDSLPPHMVFIFGESERVEVVEEKKSYGKDALWPKRVQGARKMDLVVVQERVNGMNEQVRKRPLWGRNI